MALERHGRGRTLTFATLLAAAAGGIAALGVTDLAQAWSRGRATAARRLALALLARAGRAARDLAARLEVAGVDTPPGDVMAVKAGAALVALLATCRSPPICPAVSGRRAVRSPPPGAFLAPDVWLRRRARHRRLAVEAELADVLDLLRVAVAAGPLGRPGARRGRPAPPRDARRRAAPRRTRRRARRAGRRRARAPRAPLPSRRDRAAHRHAAPRRPTRRAARSGARGPGRRGALPLRPRARRARRPGRAAGPARRRACCALGPAARVGAAPDPDRERLPCGVRQPVPDARSSREA